MSPGVKTWRAVLRSAIGGEGGGGGMELKAREGGALYNSWWVKDRGPSGLFYVVTAGKI